MNSNNPTVQKIADDAERMANLAGKITVMQAELKSMGLNSSKYAALRAMLGTNEINEFEYLAAFVACLDVEWTQ